MIEALQEVGVAEPFPRAFDSDTYRLSVADPASATGTLGQQARRPCRRLTVRTVSNIAQGIK
jgi:hypothetical protein